MSLTGDPAQRVQSEAAVAVWGEDGKDCEPELWRGGWKERCGG